ncbi:MAG: sugar ABC transporter substrate-binding protein, partial [Bauldia litoralis]
MKLEVYNQLLRTQASRRAVLRGAAGVGAAAALGSAGIAGPFGPLMGSAQAQDNIRAEILKIPGVGMGSPTDADWQKVGELCLGGTRET